MTTLDDAVAAFSRNRTDQGQDDHPHSSVRTICLWVFDSLRIWRLVERNSVNDGFVFWVRALAYDLAVKILSDPPAGSILYGHRIDETSLTESCVSPLNKCGHDFRAKTLPVRAFLEPKAKFGRNRIGGFKRGHAEAFVVVEPPDDERKIVRFRSLHSLLASRHVLTP